MRGGLKRKKETLKKTILNSKKKTLKNYFIGGDSNIENTSLSEAQEEVSKEADNLMKDIDTDKTGATDDSSTDSKIPSNDRDNTINESKKVKNELEEQIQKLYNMIKKDKIKIGFIFRTIALPCMKYVCLKEEQKRIQKMRWNQQA